MWLNVSIKGLRSRIHVFRVLPWYLTWKIRDDSPVRKKMVAGGEIVRVMYNLFLAIHRKQWLSGWGESQWVWQLGFDSWGVLKCSAAPRPFCVALSPSVFWHTRLLYCCALYNCFFSWISSVAILRSGSCAERVVNLNTTIWLPLLWRTWTRARARTCPHVLAWHIGRDYSDCRASELTDRRVTARSVASFFPDFSKIQKKQRPRKRLF